MGKDNEKEIVERLEILVKVYGKMENYKEMTTPEKWMYFEIIRYLDLYKTSISKDNREDSFLVLKFLFAGLLNIEIDPKLTRIGFDEYWESDELDRYNFKNIPNSLKDAKTINDFLKEEANPKKHLKEKLLDDSEWKS